MTSRIHNFIGSFFAAIWLSCSCNAAVTQYTDYSAWLAATGGGHTTVDFTGFPQFHLISTQYTNLGVQFTDGDNYTIFGTTTYPQDGWGLQGGANGYIQLRFTELQYYLGTHHPGTMRYQLFYDNDPIEDHLTFFGSGVNRFSGIVSSQPFNGIRIWDWIDDDVSIDNLYFGVPTPGALGVFALGAILGRSRRRAG